MYLPVYAAVFVGLLTACGITYAAAHSKRCKLRTNPMDVESIPALDPVSETKSMNQNVFRSLIQFVQTPSWDPETSQRVDADLWSKCANECRICGTSSGLYGIQECIHPEFSQENVDAGSVGQLARAVLLEDGRRRKSASLRKIDRNG